jgi:predicted RNA-binding protein with TRAM domain
MEISEQLTCLFAAEVEEHDQSYVVEIPKQEVEEGFVDASRTHKIALLSTAAESPTDETNFTRSDTESDTDQSGPPVSVGEQRVVERDEIGDQGDGLTRVERGYVVIVPETEIGERVRIEIRHVRETVGFADVVERFRY